MSDVAARFGEEELAELSALADGTLPTERRAELEARVAASPELQELLERQRRALVAITALADEAVPETLRAAVEARGRARRGKRGRRRWFAPSLGLAGVAAVAATVAALVLSGGPGAPTVAEAAQLATQPATAPAPPAGSSGTRLAVAVEGVAFPDFSGVYGWRPLGVRRGEIDARAATVVFYGNGGRRVGYVIVAGEALERPSNAQATSIQGVRYQTLELNGGPAVTWRRAGHTCILLGQASRAELLTLATYQLSPV